MEQFELSAEEILARAVEITDAAQRRAFIADACGADTALRSKVDRLAANHFRAGSFLERPAATLEIDETKAPTELVGSRIGPYRLLEKLGEGGMGVVYLAEQLEPVRRQVALKLMRPGLDSKEILARFDAERQALALMDHPNIAKVLDAGVSELGRPYFVMELIRGIPITEYCDRARLTVRQRLEVFLGVCRAIQHAHTKGVIHRDLKPTNVLVTSLDGVPMPIVIDFGVAKATAGRLTDHTLHTGFTQLVGTPLYMSPEQLEFNQLGVDTRSDIYALGVLLYELLTGVTPFDRETLRQAGLDELRRIVREQEPPLPSQRISTLNAEKSSTASHRRGVDERRLAPLLRGELDWIVMKALEKDRARRYETASAFAADVQRYLNDEPVEAGAPSRLRKLRKFAWRHRNLVGMAAVILLALLAATVISWRQAQVARRAAQAESEQRQQSERNLRLALDALDQVYLDVAERRLPLKQTLDTADRELLRRALVFYEQLSQANAVAPNARHERAKALLRVAELRHRLGLGEEAGTDAQDRAIAILDALVREFPGEAQYRATLQHGRLIRADILSATGQYAESEQEYRRSESLAADLAAAEPANVDFQHNLAHVKQGLEVLLKKMQRYDDAQQLERQALEIEQRLAEQNPRNPRFRRSVAVFHVNRAVDLRQRGELDEAATETRRAIELLEPLAREMPDDHETKEALATACHYLAVFYRRDNLPEQERLHCRGLELRKQLVRAYPSVLRFQADLAESYDELAILYQMQGRDAEAGQASDEGLRVFEQLVADAPDIVQYQSKLGAALGNRAILMRNQGRLLQAYELLQRAIRHQTIALEGDPGHPQYREFLGIHYRMLAVTQELLAKYEQAVESYRKSTEIDPRNFDARLMLAQLLLLGPDLNLRKPAEGLALALEATNGEPQNWFSWALRGVAHYQLGEYADAQRALENGRKLLGDRTCMWAGFYLVMARWQLGEEDAARTLYDQLVKLLDNQPPDEELWRPAYTAAMALVRTAR